MGVVTKQATLTSIVSYAGILLGLVNKFFLFPNFLHSAEVGLANFILETSVLLAHFSLLGSASVLLKQFPNFRDDKGGHQGLLRFVSQLSLVGYVMMLVIFFLFRSPILEYFESKSPLVGDYYGYILLLVFALLYTKLFSMFLRSLYKTFVPSLIQEVVVRLGTTIVISLYATRVIGFEAFVLLFTLLNASSLIMIVAYLMFLRQGHFFRPISDQIKKLRGSFIKFSLTSFMNEISAIMIVSVDSIMIAGILGLNQVGIYTTMLYVTAAIMIPGRTLISNSAPRVAEFWVKSEMERMQNLYKRVSGINAIISIFLFVLLWINFDALFSFIPETYRAGKWVVLFLGISRLLDSTTGLNTTILVTSPRYRLDLLFNGLLLGSAIFLNAWLIPIHGITGSAIATMIAYGLVNLLRAGALALFYRLNPLSWTIVKALLAGAAAFGVNWLMPTIPNEILDIAVRSLIVGAVYLLIIFFTKASPDIEGHVKNILRKAKVIR
jgi:O-antigen/teichoic acid export membrane protein